MRDWLEPQPIEVPEALRQVVGGHPLVAEALLRRGVADPERARAFLDPSFYDPAPPTCLPGMQQAVARLAQAVLHGEPILVWGDFDVDGLASTAILVEALRALGAMVRHHVPGRGEGHGVHVDALRRLLGERATSLVVTCDTGIGAAEAAAYARARGVDMVITDHHALPEELPAAGATVNPCFLPAGDPLRTLPGAGCAYLVAAALAGALGHGERPGGCADTDAPRHWDIECGLDLLGLAIVADVATLQGDARYYLQRGLAALRSTPRPGLQALYEVAGLAHEGVDEEHVAFAIAPRLNALGRLSDAEAGVELFLTEDLTRARTIAAETEGLNNRRQLLTVQVLQAAREQIERDPASRQAPILVASHPAWPGGIVGLVAGRLSEEHGKPAVVLATPAGGLARGSARSVPGVDVAAAIAAVGDLLVSHGGHPMAAGLALRPEHLPELRRRLGAEVARQAAAAPPAPPLAIDACVELSQAAPELARDLQRLAPFGPGNPPVLLLARRLRVVAQAAVGRTGEHRRLYLQDEAGRTHRVFWWQAGNRPAPEGIFDLAYTMRPSNYQGREEVTVQWVAARVVEAPPAVLVVAGPAYEVFDHRDDPAPEVTLKAVLALGPLLVWSEGMLPEGVQAVDRLAAVPAEALALWTAPAGPLELAAILERIGPRRVHLFALDPGVDEPGVFFRRLAGLVKYAMAHYEGIVDEALLERMAAQMAQRVSTVRCGLRWLAAQGRVAMVEGAGAWQVSPGPTSRDPAAAREAGQQLDHLLRDTAAYRAYARRADPHILLAPPPGPPHPPDPAR